MAAGSKHQKPVAAAWGKHKAVRNGADRRWPLTLRAAEGFGGFVETAIFDVGPHNQLNRESVGEQTAVVASRLPAAINAYLVGDSKNTYGNW